MAKMDRKWLEELGLNEEQVDAVAKRHSEVLREIKTERDTLRETVEAAEDVKDQLEKANATIKRLQESGGRAAQLQKELDDYKASVEAEKLNGKRMEWLLGEIAGSGITRETFKKAVARDFDLAEVKFGDDGKVTAEAAESIRARLKGEDYNDYRSTEQQRGTPPMNPASSGGKMTRDELMKKPLAEQMEYANNNPAEYAAIMKG